MENEFIPPRRTGTLFQGSISLALVVAGGYFFFLAAQDTSGLDFLLHMVIALVLFAPLPLFIYRLYALRNATYVLRRDGLMIHWGLRHEDIPLDEIEWMRPAGELGFRLPLPWMRWMGGILGRRNVPELGQVEFMAADTKHMVLVATPEKIYAISPEATSQFMALFQQLSELGSLTPLEAQSVYPTVLIGRVWEDRLARILILGSFGIGLLLLAAVAIAVPGLETISWTSPGTTAPAERLLLLPILDGLIWLFNLLVGVLIFRRARETRIAAYLLWSTAALSAVLLLAGSLLIIF